MATDFPGAVSDLRSIALTQFTTALNIVKAGPPTPVPDTAPAVDREVGKKAAAAFAKAESELAAAFKQIGDTDHVDKEHDGYADVAQLMKTTASTAYAVCLKIGTVMNALPVSSSATTEIAFQPNQIKQLEALTGVLHALAALSPAAIWQQASAADAAK